MENDSQKIFYFLFLMLLALGFLLFLDLVFEKEKDFYENIFQESAISFELIERFKELREGTLIFVGDIMLDRGVEYMVKKEGKGDWKFPFLKITDYFKEADILFGNLEGPISDKGEKVGSIYSFQAEPEAIKGLIFAGFDVLSVANNHIFDYGRSAMEDHFQRFKKAGIDYVGGGFNETEACSPVIKETRGTKIAFLGYTNLGSEYWSAKGEKSGIAWLDETITEDIKKTKEENDLVIVSVHWGEEYQKVTREQEFFGHLAIDSGADLVIGHHPHIIQKIEEYQGKYIFYSLGNFVFDQGFSEQTLKGLIVEVKIESGEIKEIIPHQIKLNKFFQPEINVTPQGGVT